MNALKERLRRHEGFSPTPYKDDRGNWTVGIGHKLTGEIKDVYHLHELDAFFINDVYKASNALMSCDFVCLLNLTRREVCVELIFWVGVSGFKKFKKMIAAIRQKDWQLAALELYNSELGKNYSFRARELAVLMWEGHA